MMRQQVRTSWDSHVCKHVIARVGISRVNDLNYRLVWIDFSQVLSSMHGDYVIYGKHGIPFAFCRASVKTGSYTTEKTVSRHRPLINCLEDLDLPEETLSGKAGMNVHRGSSGTLLTPIHT